MKAKAIDVPDYTLDYGYEGDDVSGEEEPSTERVLSSLVNAENSSGYNDACEPFGETFDALNQLSDGEDYSGDESHS